MKSGIAALPLPIIPLLLLSELLAVGVVRVVVTDREMPLDATAVIVNVYTVPAARLSRDKVSLVGSDRKNVPIEKYAAGTPDTVSVMVSINPLNGKYWIVYVAVKPICLGSRTKQFWRIAQVGEIVMPKSGAVLYA